MGWIGAVGTVLVLAGLAGILYSLVKLMQMRKAGLADVDYRKRMQNLLPVNLVSLMIAATGLMVIVVDLLF